MLLILYITKIKRYIISNCNKIESKKYLGTKAQWNAISKDCSWCDGCNSISKVECIDGNIDL